MKWTEEEDVLLTRLVARVGTKDWPMIASYLPGITTTIDAQGGACVWGAGRGGYIQGGWGRGGYADRRTI
jgi:hypothetical protein